MNDEIFYLFMTLLRYRMTVPVKADVINDSKDVGDVDAEAVGRRTVKAFEMPTTLPNHDTMKRDVRALADASLKLEKFFIQNKALECIESPTIKFFMKNVEELYEANTSAQVLETIWINVCRLIVLRKIPQEATCNFTTLRALGFILEAHNIKPSEFDGVTMQRYMMPILEKSIRDFLGDQDFKWKKYSRTLLICAYLAYYAPPLSSQE